MKLRRQRVKYIRISPFGADGFFGLKIKIRPMHRDVYFLNIKKNLKAWKSLNSSICSTNKWETICMHRTDVFAYLKQFSIKYHFIHVGVDWMIKVSCQSNSNWINSDPNDKEMNKRLCQTPTIRLWFVLQLI